MYDHSTNMQYTYDCADGRSRLVWTRSHLLEVTTYAYGAEGLLWSRASGEYQVYHYDYRGSVIAVADIDGNITDTLKYSAYGKVSERTGTSNLIFGYNGRYGVLTDPNGLLYMRTRYYSPDFKRFMSADIIDGSIADSTTLNLYAYVNGNPTSFIDPFGLSAERGENNVKYKTKHIDEINGIGLLPDGTVLAGRNVSDYDILALVAVALMYEKNYSREDIIDYIDSYMNNHKYTTLVRDKGLEFYTNFQDITLSLTQELLRLEYEHASIIVNNELITYNEIPFMWVVTLSEFKEKVQNKGDWDLKQKTEWQQSSLYYFNGELVDMDAPGNILYGYMGKVYGIPDQVLFWAAGYAQLSAGTSSLSFISSNFDDPIDQANIQRGIDYYNKLHN